MITSITFKPNEEARDYRNAIKYRHVVTEPEEEPREYPDGTRRGRRGYERDYDMVPDGYRNPLLRHCLTDREITFSKDRVNIIFGPNGCGKTTILRCLASACLCGDQFLDGWTSAVKIEPGDYIRSIFCDDPDSRFTREELVDKIHSKAGVVSDVVWDGEPVLYHNMDARRDRPMEQGGLTGGILHGMGEELTFRLDSQRQSAGENGMWLFSMLVGEIKNGPGFGDVIARAEEKSKGANSIWRSCFESTMGYLRERHASGGSGVRTLLLDEVDKSLDIMSVLMLYKKVLPKIARELGVQVIAVTHNPVILIESIRESDEYNIISMSEQYTEACVRQLADEKF